MVTSPSEPVDNPQPPNDAERSGGDGAQDDRAVTRGRTPSSAEQDASPDAATTTPEDDPTVPDPPD